MDSLEVQLTVPDLWQQRALRALQAGKDVIVAAPTGAGKTYIFELLIETGFRGQAVYTVPTRALANDKRLEWKRRGWQVGICTGDRAEALDAAVVVATLETQKARLLRGDGPDLLVVDEYQMLAHPQRGLNYELAIACAPLTTRLLLLSGSVGNAQQVADWLRRLGRPVERISHFERPVPLEEIQVDALPDNIPDSVRGLWPRTIARALKAGMAPLLAFAPRRKAAEDLAIDLARMLPEEDPLVLTPEQSQLAGDSLRRLLKARIAFHHSGLDYAQRAGLIEPLAKAGQLRVVVATMGLAAGINFSMRSVLVTDREYRSGDHTHEVRPDELLQMFGRAGRRGMDKVGYIVAVPGKPRLQEARPLRLRRSQQVDWPSLLSVMQLAIQSSRDPAEAAHNLTGRLFSQQHIFLGLQNLMASGRVAQLPPRRILAQSVVEIQNPDGQWERKRTPRPLPLADCWYCSGKTWLPALSVPSVLQSITTGSLCRLESPNLPRYGRQWALARFGSKPEEGELVLNRGLLRALREHPDTAKRRWHRFRWSLDRLESTILPLLPTLSSGGSFVRWIERSGNLYAQLAYEKALAHAHADANGRGLLNPPERIVTHEADLSMHEAAANPGSTNARSIASIWLELGLIDQHAAPTRRGILFSFFNYGEGLAIAAALEDPTYPIDELILDLANIRAGHRFAVIDDSSSRLAAACRAAFGMVTYPGYLLRGLPPTYGEGAAECIFDPQRTKRRFLPDSELRPGDVERAHLEWRSMISHIAAAPKLNWDRWLELRLAARQLCARFPQLPSLESLPPLTIRQRSRHKSFLQFDHHPPELF